MIKLLLRLTLIALVHTLIVFTPLKVEANKILLPWIIKSDTVLSLVTVSIIGGVELNLTYYYKKDMENSPSSSCDKTTTIHLETRSLDSTLAFDASCKINDGRLIWSNAKNVFYENENQVLGLSVPGPRRAVMEIESPGNIVAEAMIVDIANGAAWGYAGIDYSDSLNKENVLNTSPKYFFTFWKPEFTTKIFITPVGPEGKAGNYCVKVGANLGYHPSESGNSLSQSVTCTGVFDLKDIATPDLLKYRQAHPNDVILTTISITNTCNSSDVNMKATDVYVGKLEYTLKRGRIYENSYVEGTFNNFVILDPVPSSLP